MASAQTPLEVRGEILSRIHTIETTRNVRVPVMVPVEFRQMDISEIVCYGTSAVRSYCRDPSGFVEPTRYEPSPDGQTRLETVHDTEVEREKRDELRRYCRDNHAVAVPFLRSRLQGVMRRAALDSYTASECDESAGLLVDLVGHGYVSAFCAIEALSDPNLMGSLEMKRIAGEFSRAVEEVHGFSADLD